MGKFVTVELPYSAASTDTEASEGEVQLRTKEIQWYLGLST